MHKIISKTIFLQVLNSVIVFIIHIVMTNNMSPDDYGQLVYILSLATFAQLPILFGLDSAASKIIPSARAENRTGVAITFFIFSLCWILISSAIVTIVVHLLINSGIWEINEKRFPLLFFKLIFLTASASLMFGVGRAFEKHVKTQWVQSFLVPIVKLALLFPLVFVNNLSLYSIIYTYFASSFVAFCVMIMINFHSFRMKETASYNFARNMRDNLKKWISLATSFVFSGAAFMLIRQGDILMLGIFADGKSVAMYAVASRSAIILRFATVSIGNYLAPKISSTALSGNTLDLQKLITRSVRLGFVFALILGIALSSLAAELLSLFGQEYLESQSLMYILIASTLLSSMFGPANRALSFIGYHWHASANSWLAAFLNVVLNFMLIPSYGAMGAAVATTIALLFWSFLAWMILLRKAGLNSSIFCRISHVS